MILLLGKNNAVERYAKEILNIDIDNDIVHYSGETTHYTELSKWVELAKEDEPYVVTTQRLDMIDAFLYSDLEFRVITVFEVNGNIKGRVLESREKAIYVKDILGLELR
mgnify:CR=1 FL=1